MISTLSIDVAMKPELRQDLLDYDFRILVVDDEYTIRDFVAGVLGDAGYAVETAANAAEALEKIHEQHFDLLLTDYQMPRKTGFELISQMRADGREIPVVMMTGRTAELFAKHPDIQVSAVLSKPFMLSELLDLTASVLRSIGQTATTSPKPSPTSQIPAHRRTAPF